MYTCTHVCICYFVAQKSALRSYPVCLGEDLIHLTQPRDGHPLIVISVHPLQQDFVSCTVLFCISHFSHSSASDFSKLPVYQGSSICLDFCCYFSFCFTVLIFGVYHCSVGCTRIAAFRRCVQCASTLFS